MWKHTENITSAENTTTVKGLLASCTFSLSQRTKPSDAPCYTQAWQRLPTKTYCFALLQVQWSITPGLIANPLSITTFRKGKMFRNSYQCKQDCGISHFGNRGTHDCGAPEKKKCKQSKTNNNNKQPHKYTQKPHPKTTNSCDFQVYSSYNQWTSITWIPPHHH